MKLVKSETFQIFCFVFIYDLLIFQNAGNNTQYFFIVLTAFLQPNCYPSYEAIFCVVTYMTLDGLDYV